MSIQLETLLETLGLEDLVTILDFLDPLLTHFELSHYVIWTSWPNDLIILFSVTGLYHLTFWAHLHAVLICQYISVFSQFFIPHKFQNIKEIDMVVT